MPTADALVDAGVASMCATLVSNPFDVMRTRMQLQGEMCKHGEYEVLYKNMAQGMLRVAREEGLLALQNGLVPAILWQVTQNGIRLGLYPTVRAQLGDIFHSDALYVSATAGALCGLIGNYVSSPFQMIKTRLQSQQSAPKSMTSAGTAAAPPYAPASAHRYRGVCNAFQKIYTQGGVRALWSGSNIAAQRTMVLSATQLTSYDVAKRHLCEWTSWSASDIRVHTCAAFFSAMCIVAFVNPLDVVMTRCFNKRAGAASVYSSNLAIAVAQVYRTEGVHGLYKGALPVFARYVPHNITTFVVLEFLHKLRAKHVEAASVSSESKGAEKTA